MDGMEIYYISIRIRAWETDQHIQNVTGIAGSPIRKYPEWAEAQGPLYGNVSDLLGLHQRVASILPAMEIQQNLSSAALYHDLIEGLLKDQVEIAAMHQRSQE